MALLNNYIKVKELTDNLEMDGMIEKYDDTSPYIYAKIIDADINAIEKLTMVQELSGRTFTMNDLLNKCVLVFKRVTKIRGFNGLYVQLSDLIEIISKEEYEKYVYRG